MRLLVLTPFLGAPPDAGGRIRIGNLLRALAGAHEVVNVTGLSDADKPEHRKSLEDLGVKVVGTPLRPRFGKLGFGDRVVKLAQLLAGRSSLPPRFFDADLARAITAEVRAGPDLVVIDQLWMGVYQDLLGMAPRVYSSHNVESDVLVGKIAAESSRLARRVAAAEARALARFEAGVVRSCRLTIAVSEEDRARFLGLAPGTRVETVGNGVDLAARRLLAPASLRPLRLFFVGQHSYAPNARAAHRLATRIFPRIRTKLPDSELAIAGDDPEKSLRSLAGLPGVSILGHVAEVVPFFEQASILVVPLDQGGGTRVKILESWALGRPVVATPLAAEGLGARHEKDLLLATTDQELADAVLRLAENPGLAASLVANARTHVEADYDWRALGARFVAHCESVMR